MKYIFIFAIFVTGCSFLDTKTMVEISTVHNNSQFHEIVNKLQETADECWSSTPLIITHGIKVKKVVNEDQAEIIMNLYNIFGELEDPYLKIKVTNDTEGVDIRILQREHAYLGKSSYTSDAMRWANGDFSCS